MEIVSINKQRLLDLKISEIYMNAIVEELNVKTPKEALERIRKGGIQ